MPVNVLFISHDASRTGAPIVLLHLLKWIKLHSDIRIYIILKNGGELENDFRKLGPTDIWNNKSETESRSLIKKGLTKLGVKRSSQNYQEKIKEKLIQFEPNLIYANTVVSSDLGVDFRKMFNCPLICHIHELEVAINRYFGKENFIRVRHTVDNYIAVSTAVKENLISNHSIPESKINKINAFIPAIEYASEEQGAKKIKEELSIPENAFVVGGCGTTDWRKSPDLFVQVANLVSKKEKDKTVYFVWVGGDSEGVEYTQLVHDIKTLNLKNIVFLGVKNDPLKYFSAFDLFLLTSREDPYPLVCLEAAALSKPIICFEGAGGMPEFVEKDCGFVAPFLDTEYMANAIVQLVNNESLRATLGKNACAKVIQKHDTSVSSMQISTFITEVAGRKI